MSIQRIAHLLTAVALVAGTLGCRTQGAAPIEAAAGKTVVIPHYLEIVTPEVDATCDSLEKTHGVSFGDPQPGLGGARTAPTPGGGQIGVRAPMHSAENSVVRPYLLVTDIEAALANATAAGAMVAMAPTPAEGGGVFAIYFLGGIEHGLWQH